MNKFQKIRPWLATFFLLLGAGAVFWAGPEQIGREFRKVGPELLGQTALFLLAANGAGALRFRTLGRLVGLQPASYWQSYFVGNLGTLLPLPILGQTMARQWSAGKTISPELNSMVVLLERGLTAGVGALLAIAGAVHLLGWIPLEEFVRGTRSLPMAVGIGLTGLAAFFWLISSQRREKILGLLSRQQFFLPVVMGLFLTLIQCLCTIAAYVTAAQAVWVGIPAGDLAAAAAAISFCAGFPVSFAGWGTREVASIFFLGTLGAAPAQALAASVILGGLSILWVVLLGCAYGSAFSFQKPLIHKAKNTPRKPVLVSPPALAKLFLPAAACIAIFYQFHIPFLGGEMSLNFGDPLAILALAAAISVCLQNRKLPSWKIPGFNGILLVSGLLIWAWLGVALVRLGHPPLAMTSRGLGWLVVMGYLSLGLLLRASGVQEALRLSTFLLGLSASTAILTDAAFRFLAHFNLSVGSVPFNFEGFSGNRNAFAFQLLAILCLLLPVAGRRFPAKEQWLAPQKVMPLLGGAILMTGSRTGWICLLLLFAFAMVVRMVSPSIGLKTLLQSALVFLGLAFSSNPEILESAGQATAFFIDSGSTRHRTQINQHALMLFWQSPWIGQGIGVYLEASKAFLPEPSVIHNTLLNTLTETGVVGLAVCLTMTFFFLRGVLRQAPKQDPARESLLLLILLFFVFSQFHEISFQRTFWFLLGLLVARKSLGGADRSRARRGA